MAGTRIAQAGMAEKRLRIPNEGLVKYVSAKCLVVIPPQKQKSNKKIVRLSVLARQASLSFKIDNVEGEAGKP